MRIGAHATIVAASVAAGAVGLIGSAFAADMTGAEIKAFLSGKTAYLETTAASATGTPGQGIDLLGRGWPGPLQTPTGAIWQGKWEIKGNTLCADWRERPNNPCTRYDKTGDTVSVLDTVSGQTRPRS